MYSRCHGCCCCGRDARFPRGQVWAVRSSFPSALLSRDWFTRDVCDGTHPRYRSSKLGQVFWRRNGAIVAAAVSEPWYRLGGPDLYHDSYTTCIFLEPSAIGGLVQSLRDRVQEDGGCIDEVVDLAGALSA